MTFDRAWRTFVDEERSRHAPAELETRVRHAIANRPPQRSRRPQRALAGLALAASLGIAAAWSIAYSKRDQQAITPSLQAGHPPPLALYAASASSEKPRTATPALPRPNRGGLGHAHTPLLRASNGTSSEALQLVRVRMPRQVLATWGLILTDPEAAGVVQVDVLIGEDGVPRDIRKVWFEP
jgi:hypothetical protein